MHIFHVKHNIPKGCDNFVSHKAISVRHLGTAFCRRREESAAPGRGVGAGADSEVDHRLWYPPFPDHLLQLPWESPLGGRQLLASIGPKPLEGTAEVGAVVSGAEKGGSRCLDLG